MWKANLSCVLASALTLLSLQARAQDAEIIADVRCVIVGIRLAGMADPSQESAGTMLSLYYIGRLDGRAPKLDVEDLMIREISRMTTQDFASESKRCGASLTEKGRQITSIGKAMNERGQEMLDKAITQAR
jgi:hypothetical protein